MSPITARILFAIFLLAHGWIHMSLAQVPPPEPGKLRTPFFPSWWRDSVDTGWPVSRLGLAPATVRTVGWLLWVVTVALYTLAALALLFAPGSAGLWQGLTVGGSVASLVLLALYWHPWLPAGVLIDLVLIAGVLLRWPWMRFGG
jgi:hypothetical protein